MKITMDLARRIATSGIGVGPLADRKMVALADWYKGLDTATWVDPGVVGDTPVTRPVIGDGDTKWQHLRDKCDGYTYGDLDWFRLNMLTDWVQQILEEKDTTKEAE